jgi:hypothetical protein
MTPFTTEEHKEHFHQQCRGLTFPSKLHLLLEQVEKFEDGAATISWLPNGKSFKIHNKKEFARSIMPTFFKSSVYKTFQRSLNLWGFRAVKREAYMGAFYHPCFQRGQPDLCRSMIRTQVKTPSRQPRMPCDDQRKVLSRDSRRLPRPLNTASLSSVEHSSRRLAAEALLHVAGYASQSCRTGMSNQGSSPLLNNSPFTSPLHRTSPFDYQRGLLCSVGLVNMHHRRHYAPFLVRNNFPGRDHKNSAAITRAMVLDAAFEVMRGLPP